MLKRVIEGLSYENKISKAIYTEIFCDVDDFYQSFEQHCRSIPQLTAVTGERRCPKGYRFAYSSRMSLSEVMTKRDRESWKWLQDIQGILYSTSTTSLEKSFS